ncbi:MAG: cell division protein ZapA [Pseudomonadota bacterium]
MSKTEINVNGKRYVVSCEPGQESRLEELGAEMDRRARDLSGAMGDIGVERLFLVLGLSLIDELDVAKNGSDAAALDARIASIEQRAAQALVDAASRIEALSARADRAS